MGELYLDLLRVGWITLLILDYSLDLSKFGIYLSSKGCKVNIYPWTGFSISTTSAHVNLYDGFLLHSP